MNTAENHRVSAQDFAHNLAVIKDRIVAAGGDPSVVKIVAVSKGQPFESIESALDVGQRLFGENYADELVSKATAINRVGTVPTAHPEWHFQGRLQSNKINRLKPFVSVWQTVDSVERANALAQRVPGATVLVQINSSSSIEHGRPVAQHRSVDSNPDRSGAPIQDVAGIVAHAQQSGLLVVGLMTVAPLANGGPTRTTTEQAFRSLSELADQLSLPERSMGMSDDLEIAIQAGATMLRVGAALFGPRR